MTPSVFLPAIAAIASLGVIVGYLWGRDAERRYGERGPEESLARLAGVVDAHRAEIDKLVTRLESRPVPRPSRRAA